MELTYAIFLYYNKLDSSVHLDTTTLLDHELENWLSFILRRLQRSYVHLLLHPIPLATPSMERP